MAELATVTTPLLGPSLSTSMPQICQHPLTTKLFLKDAKIIINGRKFIRTLERLYSVVSSHPDKLKTLMSLF